MERTSIIRKQIKLEAIKISQTSARNGAAIWRTQRSFSLRPLAKNLWMIWNPPKNPHRYQSLITSSLGCAQVQPNFV